LDDLVKLATECSQREAEIERTLADALAAAETGLDKDVREGQRRAKHTEEATQKKYDDHSAQLTQQFEADQKGLRDNTQTARRRIDHEYNQRTGTVKNDLEQATWLAESVDDGTLVQVNKDYETKRESVADGTAALDALDQETAELIDLYHVSIPPTTFPDHPATPDTPTDLPAELTKADEAFVHHKADVERGVHTLRSLVVPRLFVGLKPYLAVTTLVIVAGIAGKVLSGPELDIKQIGIFAGGALVGSLVIGFLLRMMAVSQVRKMVVPIRLASDACRHATKQQLKIANEIRTQKITVSARKRDAETQKAKSRSAPALTEASRDRDQKIDSLGTDQTKQLARLTQKRDKGQVDADAWLGKQKQEITIRAARDQEQAVQTHRQRIEAAHQAHDHARGELEQGWSDGLKRIQNPQDDGATNLSETYPNGSDPKWRPPLTFPAAVRFGALAVDLKSIAAPAATDNGHIKLAMPETFAMPALLAFPKQASLLIQHDRTGRERAIKTLQMLMSRLLTSLPAGRVRFTIIDPVGLGQNFAGFMHLADYDEALVGSRIWTDSEQIDQRLADLTEHMETVIQKYLRNEYPTIDDYNAQAGELAEPYRFLVISDFPANFSDDALRRLASIASTGARCGVYVLIARDTRLSLPSGARLDDLEANCVNLIQEGEDSFVWRDEVFGRFPLKLDDPPAEDALTKLLHVVGKYAKEASRVEVSFDTIAPTEAEYWTGDATSELRVPIGRSGATRRQALRLGKGVAQHVLIAGKTGSGKSTLLHAIVTNVAMWYTPEEVEVYLVDFKKGVEFKTYASHELPHARAVAVESDREFGLSVLQRLDAELSRRGELYRKAAVQDLAGYRGEQKKSAGALPKLPRVLLVIDEFQEFFSEDDKLAQDSSLLIDRLVRQGRAFGVHVLLGSQTIGGSGGLSRSTLGQMAVRIALQTSEADSQLILGDGNSAARLLSRPGEAIYNDQGGLVEANSPFQISWLPDAKRDGYLKKVLKSSRDANFKLEPQNVFEGNAPAEILKNRKLLSLIKDPTRPDRPATPVLWLGDPVAIKDATAVPMRRQSGANLLMIGQQEEQALAMMSAAVVSLAAQHKPGNVQFYIFDGSAADSPYAGTLAQVADAIGHEVKLIDYRSTADVLHEIFDELHRRQAGDEGNPNSIFVMLYGMQRYRMIRKQEESFSLSMDEGEPKPKPDKEFAEILREGPPLGIHVISWVDTQVSLDRTLDRSSVREFDHRILMQMSANDSSALIDSPAANKLGLYRALSYSEEAGTMEKFRPYGLPDKEWLEFVKSGLNAG